MGRLTVTGTIATTRPLDKYGGVQIPLETLEKLCETIEKRPIPMEMNHRAAETIDAKVIAARVERLSDDEHALLVDFEVDEDVWAGVQEDWQAAGVPGGLSPGLTQLQEEIEAPTGPSISFISDAGAYSDEDRAEAARRIGAVAPIRVLRLFQFSELDLAKVAVEFTREVGAEALVAAIAYLVGRRRGLSHIEMKRVEPSGVITTAVLDTDDPEIVRAAAESLDAEDAPPSPVVLVYDDQTNSWRTP